MKMKGPADVQMQLRVSHHDPQVKAALKSSSSPSKKKMKHAVILTKLSSNGGVDNDHPLGLDTASVLAHSVSQDLMQPSPFTEHGRNFIEVACNPCGEHAEDVDARIPDGAVTYSAIKRLALFETIAPPWSSLGSLPANLTNNWALFGWSPPCYRTAAILIASRSNQSISDTTETLIYNKFNTSPVADYPSWTAVSEDPATSEFFFCRLNYDAADLQLDKGLSKLVESFRIIAEGQVWHHNTPDLWNQGSFAVGQFPTNQILKDADQNTTTATLTVETTAKVGQQVAYTAEITYPGPINGGVLMAKVTKPLASIGVTGQLIAQPSNGYTLENVAPAQTVFAPLVTAGAPLNVSCSQTDANSVVTIQAVGGAPVTFFVPQNPSTIKIDFVMFGQILNGETINDNFFEINPNTMQQSKLVQRDPKFSAELMKDHGGFYAVRRIFEPMMNMNEVIEAGTIFARKPGMDRVRGTDTSGGIQDDSVDKNFGTINFAIRGISYAANPTVKAVRYIEEIEGEEVLATFNRKVLQKDTYAVDTWRELSMSGPHSYVPDANSVGLLAAFVANVVENIPAYLKSAISITSAVSRALEHVEAFFGW